MLHSADHGEKKSLGPCRTSSARDLKEVTDVQSIYDSLKCHYW